MENSCFIHIQQTIEQYLMKYEKEESGFTLVELMVVILIIGIMAALAIPLMTGAAESSKWSEAKTAMSVIATGVRAFYVENHSWVGFTDINEMGITVADLDGTYFEYDCYTVVPNGTTDIGAPRFSIICDATQSMKPNAPTRPTFVTMSVQQDGTVTWSESSP